MCQLKYIHEIVQESSWLDNSYASLRSKLAQTYIKALFLKNKLWRKLSSTNQRPFLQDFDQPEISPGDSVRVRSKEIIKNLLDDRGAYKGCDFMEEMYDCCGKEYKVLAKVSYFYDEAKQKLCKCNNFFFLDGSYCSRRRPLILKSCDLRCFFFWHKDLLEKA